MKRKQPSRRELLSSCSDLGPEDGGDPRVFFRKGPEKKINRKTLQLCSAVAEVLGYALAWELGDDLLSQLQVESVVPAPDSSRLLVTLVLHARGSAATVEQALVRLQRVTGLLRARVAAAIH